MKVKNLNTNAKATRPPKEWILNDPVCNSSVIRYYLASRIHIPPFSQFIFFFFPALLKDPPCVPFFSLAMISPLYFPWNTLFSIPPLLRPIFGHCEKCLFHGLLCLHPRTSRHPLLMILFHSKTRVYIPFNSQGALFKVVIMSFVFGEIQACFFRGIFSTDLSIEFQKEKNLHFQLFHISHNCIDNCKISFSAKMNCITNKSYLNVIVIPPFLGDEQTFLSRWNKLVYNFIASDFINHLQSVFLH